MPSHLSHSSDIVDSKYPIILNLEDTICSLVQRTYFTCLPIILQEYMSMVPENVVKICSLVHKGGLAGDPFGDLSSDHFAGIYECGLQMLVTICSLVDGNG